MAKFKFIYGLKNKIAIKIIFSGIYGYLRRKRWSGQVARIREVRNVYKF